MVFLIVEVPELPGEYDWLLITRTGRASILAIRDRAREGAARDEMRAMLAA